MPNDVAENGPLAARNLMMDDRMWEALRAMSYKERLSISEIVRDAVESYGPLSEYLTATTPPTETA